MSQSIRVIIINSNVLSNKHEIIIKQNLCLNYLHLTFCTWIWGQSWIKKRGRGHWSLIYMIQLLNASNAQACYFPHQAVLHVATCSSSVPGSCPGVRQSCEAMVNIMRNVWRLWEGMYLPRVKRKFRTWSSLGELKKHKQNMCLQYLFCSCTIALLEEQDVLQDCFSLSFAL